MSLWPEYRNTLFVERPQAIEKIRRWADESNAKRVLVLVAPPGSGKSWLLRRMKEEWEPNRLTVWLDAPVLINRQEERNPNQMLNQAAFDEWFEEVQQSARRFCADSTRIGRFAALDARIEALVDMVCHCALNYAPLLIVDAHDEITEAQALTLSLRVLAKFISRPCTRLLIATRYTITRWEDTINRNKELFLLPTLDPLSQEFAHQQFENWFHDQFPGHPLPDLRNWMSGYRYYSWRNPAINHFLFTKATTESPASMRFPAADDLRECIQEIIQRDGRYAPLNNTEFDFLFELATKLGADWSDVEAENLLSIPNFYADPSIKKLREIGLIIHKNGHSYQIEVSIRELLLEMKSLCPAGKEDAP